MNQRLYRSREDRVIAGVAGGLAAMLNVDPSLVRILLVILVPLTGGFIILLYFVMAVVVPEPPIGEDRWQAWERSWHDPWGDQGSMDAPGTMGPMDAPGTMDAMPPAGPMDAPGARPLAAAMGEASAATSLGDDTTRPYPPVGAGADPGAVPRAEPGAGAGPGRPTTPPAGATRSAPGGWQSPMDARRSAWQTPGEESRDRGVPLIFGLILVLIGGFFLARSYIPGIDWEASWPFLLMGIGIALLLGALRRSDNRS